MDNNGDLYAGLDYKIYLSTDKGKKWKEINYTGGEINKLKSKGDYIYVFTEGSGIFRKSSNSTKWLQINNGLKSKYVSDMSFKGNYIFITTHNGLFADNSIYYSTDVGDNWISINLKLKSGNFWCIASKENHVLAGSTNGGIFYSNNDGENWINTGIEYLWINNLLFKDEYIFATAYSGSIFRAKLSDFGTVNVNEPKQNDLYTIYPNPVNEVMNIEFKEERFPDFKVEINDLLGKQYNFKTPEINNKQISINLSDLNSGIYFLLIHNNGQLQSIKFIKN